jgi:hypothetical protein
MPLPMPSKDPDEVLDYNIDWTDRLDGDTISSVATELEAGDVTIDSTNYSGAIQTIWLSGGTHGETAIVTGRIVTAGGRTMDEAIKVKIKGKET